MAPVVNLDHSRYYPRPLELSASAVNLLQALDEKVALRRALSDKHDNNDLYILKAAIMQKRITLDQAQKIKLARAFTPFDAAFAALELDADTTWKAMSEINEG